MIKSYITKLGSVLVCYSGGTDSTLLLKLAMDALGDKACGIFFDSALIPEMDKKEAIQTAKDMGAKLIVKSVDIFALPELRNNPEDRCYHCKHNILSLAKEEAAKLGLKYVLEGSHADDVHAHRPGRRAIQELDIKSPFEACGIGKAEIREISKELGLNTWNKASYSCLLTRLPHDEPILEENLRRIEKLEYYMKSLGFREFRIRHRGENAAIEIVPEEKELLERQINAIQQEFSTYGYIKIITMERSISIAQYSLKN